MKMNLKEKITWFARISVLLLREVLKMNPTNSKHLLKTIRSFSKKLKMTLKKSTNRKHGQKGH